MNSSPTLIKGYYTLGEVLQRLKNKVEIRKVEDVLQLAREGKIDVSLLCEGDITLINTKDAKPIKVSWFPDAINNKLNRLLSDDYTQDVIDSYKKDIDETIFLMTDTARVTFKGMEYKPLILHPFQLHIGGSLQEDEYFVESLWLMDDCQYLEEEELCVVRIEDETFYICKGNNSNPLAKDLKVSFSSNTQTSNYVITSTVDSKLLKKLIKKRNYVVTKEALQKFEEEYSVVIQNTQLQEIDKVLTYRDLFTCPKKSTQFDEIAESVDRYIIAKNNTVPKNHNELLDWLKYDYESIKSGVKLPSGTVKTRELLRRSWIDWTGKSDKKS